MIFQRIPRLALSFSVVAVLGACGTTYELPEVSETESAQARTMFGEARAQPARGAVPDAVAEQRFQRVASRVKPVAERLCAAETAADSAFDCNVRFAVDREAEVRNAYFGYGRDNVPTIAFTLPLLKDAQNDDEIAFIMGHEYGHLIGRHVQKQQQQAVAGMMIVGALAALAQANDPNADPNAVGRNMALGGTLGTVAFSQTYELESDVLGTRIAETAGYDAIKGARYFARPEAAKTSSGHLSFWGTHPPDEDRFAIVLSTQRQIEAGETLRRRPR